MKGRFARWFFVEQNAQNRYIQAMSKDNVYCWRNIFWRWERSERSNQPHMRETCDKPPINLRKHSNIMTPYIYIFIYLSKRNKSWVHIQVVSSLKDGFLFVSRIHRVGIRGRFLSGKLMMSCRRSAAPCRLGIECVIKHGGPLGIGRDMLTVQPVQTKINQVWLPDGKPINKHEPLGIIPVELVSQVNKKIAMHPITDQ
jgi:hypothetical protein